MNILQVLMLAEGALDENTIALAEVSKAVNEMTTCHICEKSPGTVDALSDDQPVKVCAECFEYETGGMA